MSDYFHASDLQAALATLINVQESFHEMYRICTDSITEQTKICNYLYQILDAPIHLREAEVTGRVSEKKKSSVRLNRIFKPAVCVKSGSIERSLLVTQ